MPTWTTNNTRPPQTQVRGYMTDEVKERIDPFVVLSLGFMCSGLILVNKDTFKFNGQNTLQYYGADVVVHSFKGVPTIVFIELLPHLNAALIGERIHGVWHYLLLTPEQYEVSSGMREHEAARFWEITVKDGTPFDGNVLKEGIRDA